MMNVTPRASFKTALDDYHRNGILHTKLALKHLFYDAQSVVRIVGWTERQLFDPNTDDPRHVVRVEEEQEIIDRLVGPPVESQGDLQDGETSAGPTRRSTRVLENTALGKRRRES